MAASIAGFQVAIEDRIADLLETTALATWIIYLKYMEDFETNVAINVLGLKARRPV